MVRRKSLLPLLAAFLAAAPASDATAKLTGAYPEGPLIEDRTVLFAEMHRDRITFWNGRDDAGALYESPGCGPTAIAPYADGYAVLCHGSDEIHLISPGGEFRERLGRDRDGRAFINPNDASADGQGGVWFTASGIFNRTAPKDGALLYLDAEGVIHRRAGNLHYANGVHLDRERRRLYITEHLGGRILVYPELAPGRLGRPTVFKQFGMIGAAPGGTDLTGPDGLDTDGRGNLYVALYGAGALFILESDGALLHRLPDQEPLITNVAVDGCELIVTGSRRTASKPFPGSVRRIENPVCGDE